MRVALLISGHARTWRRKVVTQSYLRMIEFLEPRVFLFQWEEDPDRAAYARFVRAHSVCCLRMGDEPPAKDFQARCRVQRRGVRRAWDMLWGDYDLVVRHRPDVEVRLPSAALELDDLLHVGLRGQNCSHRDGSGKRDDYCCDAHAYGSLSVMERYCAARDTPFTSKAEVPEEQMHRHLSLRAVQYRVETDYARRVHRDPPGQDIWLGPAR